ncbi:MAG: ATP-dependent RecD-like DNA helicase [Desulfovibrio sp.]
METLEAEVHTVVFHNEDNGYTIARVRHNTMGIVTVVGAMGTLTPGESVRLTGTWKEHPKFGRQMDVSSVEHSRPATETGVARFLASSDIMYVGPKIAERMVNDFGVEVLDILDEDPERLLEVKGITKKKLEGIKESWKGIRDIRHLILFLHEHDVPSTYAKRIYDVFGSAAQDRLKTNPYELCYVVWGIGFRTADAMALKLGFAIDSTVRLEASLDYTLNQLSDRTGDMFCPREKLVHEVVKMLDGVAVDKVEEALDQLEENRRVKIEDLPEQEIEQAVFLTRFYRVEREIAERLHGLVLHPTPVSKAKIEKALPEVENELGFELSDEQRQAVFDACVSKVHIITGGPGTGKTTITRAVVATLNRLGLKMKLAAPTGRAARRLSEATDNEASTIHRMLQYSPENGQFVYNEDQQLKTQVLVLDEVSMVDAQLFLSVLRALPLTSRLVLVGDVNQLPSVGAGNVLSDLLDSGVIPHARLTKIFRQAQESYIVRNAHRINEGELPEECPYEPPEADFYWIPQPDPNVVQSLILKSVCERIPARFDLDPMRDIQVLTPMHKGEVGTIALNKLLQEALNPLEHPDAPVVKKGGTTFREGDKVLQMRNNYDKDVFNGDLGFIVAIDTESKEISVDFDGNIVRIEKEELDDLALAYAITVHKSQGSEYEAVVMPVVTQHYVLLQRNLLYTGITRAKKLGIMVGTDRAMQIGLANTTAGKRLTNLRYRLENIFASEL